LRARKAKKTGMETHIVFIHHGSSEYLKYSLGQAKASNPGTTVHLIGDQTNNIYRFVEHHDMKNYSQSASEFAKNYQHWSTSLVDFVLFDLERWFILNEFVTSNSIDKCLSVDSDVMIYCDVESEFERLRQWDLTLGRTRYGNLAMCPSPVFWNNLEALDAFCGFMMDVYTGKDQDNYNKALNHYKNRLLHGLTGGVCDMTMFALFEQDCRFWVFHIEDVVDVSTYDMNINISVNGLLEYQMAGDIKKIEWFGGYPYGTDLKSGKKIKFNILHCASGAKKYMKMFCTGGRIGGFDKTFELELGVARNC